MTQNGKRNKLMPILLVMGLMVDLLLMGYLLYLVWDREGKGATASPVNGPTVLEQAPVDLWDAYEQAQTAVRSQAGDARLVSASTQWQAEDEEALLNGANNWTFVFYSPSMEHSLDVIVNSDKAQVVNKTRVWVAPETLGEGSWQSGPRDALLVFMAHGARSFLDQHPNAAVDLHLSADEAGDAEWTVVALDPEDKSLHSLLIDAETNHVVSG